MFCKNVHINNFSTFLLEKSSYSISSRTHDKTLNLALQDVSRMSLSAVQVAASTLGANAMITTTVETDPTSRTVVSSAGTWSNCVGMHMITRE